MNETFELLDPIPSAKFWAAVRSVDGAVCRDNTAANVRGCSFSTVLSEDNKVEKINVEGPLRAQMRLITLLAARFGTEIVLEDEELGPFIDMDEADAFAAWDEIQREARQGEIMNFLRGTFHDVRDITHPYVQHARKVAADNYELLMPGNEDLFWATVDGQVR